MKYFSFSMILVVIVSCTDSPAEHKAIVETDTIIKPGSRVFANELINGTIQPADNNETLSWVDSINDRCFATRWFAYKVYASMAPKADAALSEAISEAIHRNFIIFMGDLLEFYKNSSPLIKQCIIKDIYYGFSVEETDTHQIEQRFQHYNADCKGCDKAVLIEIKNAIIERMQVEE